MWHHHFGNMFLKACQQNKKGKYRFFSTGSDKTAHPIPQLPVLNEIADRAKQHGLPDLSRTKVIGVQHMLETTASLFQQMIKLGVKPENMFFAGKCYSNSVPVINTIKDMGIQIFIGNEPVSLGEYHESSRIILENMWNSFIKHMKQTEVDRIIVLDEGGRCLETMPQFMKFGKWALAGIEQTRAGFYSASLETLPFPLIEVASSAVKKKIESVLIAEAIINRIKGLLPHLGLKKSALCGVIGNGVIGSALVKYLLSLHYQVVVYDEDEKSYRESGMNFFRAPNVKFLIANSDIVFSSTGKDVTKELDLFDLVKKDIFLASCSSEDKEFNSFLRKLAEENRILPDVSSTFACRSNNKSRIVILSGGYPINFDRSVRSVPARDIEITRIALLGAFIQAVLESHLPFDDGVTISQSKRLALDPYLQQFGFLRWHRAQPPEKYQSELVQSFYSIPWIVAQSGGTFSENAFFKTVYSTEELSKQSVVVSSSTVFAT